MRVVFLCIVFSLSLIQVGAKGTGEESENTTNTYCIKCPRLARPLVERWIKEYAKVQPGVQLQLIKGCACADDIDMNIVLKAGKSDQNTVYFGEYAILPLTSRNSEAAKVLDGRRLSSKKLKALFFKEPEDAVYDEVPRKDKTLERLIVYSGNDSASVATSFAANFGEVASSFRGKRISGDDVFLNTAVSKDPLGVTFNALPNIYDLQSRHLKDNISLLQLDLKRTLETAINNQASLDDVIKALEQDKDDQIPVEFIGFSFRSDKEGVQQFLHWVLTEGTGFNHQYGLLNLDKHTADSQVTKVKNVYTAQK